MWGLVYFVFISPSFVASGRLYFVIVAFIGYLHLYFCIIVLCPLVLCGALIGCVYVCGLSPFLCSYAVCMQRGLRLAGAFATKLDQQRKYSTT